MPPRPLPPGADSAASSEAATSNGSGGKNASLAAILRDCAGFVERDEFHPLLYQGLALLHAYTGEKAGGAVAGGGVIAVVGVGGGRWRCRCV